MSSGIERSSWSNQCTIDSRGEFHPCGAASSTPALGPYEGNSAENAPDSAFVPTNPNLCG